LPRILKSSNVIIDKENRVSIKVTSNDISTQKSVEEAVVSEEVYGDITNNIIEETELQARALIREAERKAMNIIKEAEEKAILIIESMKKDNENIGYDDAYSKAVADTEEMKTEAESIIEEANELKKNVIRETEPELVELVISIVEKLIFKTSEIDRNLIVILIKQGLSGATLIGNVIIRVSELDYEEVVNSKEDILSKIQGNANVEIMKDISLELNDCIIETSFGDLDCSLKQQFYSLKNDLYYLLENR
jgi:flagellar assembly protein FliH